MTSMEEAILGELSHYKECLERLESCSERYSEDESAYLRGYYKGNISAYECALKLFEIQKRSFERRGFIVDS